MTVSAVLLPLCAQLFHASEQTSRIESDVLPVQSSLPTSSRYGYHATAIITLMLLAAVYYALLALPMFYALEPKRKGTEKKWKKTYATPFTLAILYLFSMWMLLLRVSSTVYTIHAYQVNSE
jgi:hypothetical protein